MAPYNFFYSKSYSYQFAGPFQHWGGQVEWQITESWRMTAGDEDNNLSGQQGETRFTNRTRYSWLVALPITCRLEYVFHHWLGYQEAGAADGGDAYWYGIDQYLHYALNDCWKLGVRFEWFRDEQGTRVGLNRPSNPNNPPFVGNFWSLSAGVNWTPTKNLTVRPELRWDWFDGTGLPYDTKTEQFMLAAVGSLNLSNHCFQSGTLTGGVNWFVPCSRRLFSTWAAFNP
ncbi:MAG: hypothetical protein EA424_06235 [Planctomycetaceae bacterium]|nr:MAG: hypothetical protein EA424_06235 [Planctomycetaceae bacterium]